MRFFNTAGPVDPADHYCLPPLERLVLDDVLSLIEQKKYFVRHAPRQTGKTPCLLVLMADLNGTGRYRCVYTNAETGQATREDVPMAMATVLSSLGLWAREVLQDEFVARTWQEAVQRNPFTALEEVLTGWTKCDPRPLVLLIDEIDTLVGDSLISVLRQLRAGYVRRPAGFPQTVILCGVRDVRDYRIHSSTEKAVITGGSAFNIKAKSLRLGDFNRAEMETLYCQYTAETSQRFLPGALDRLWTLSQGQPWLVNALGYELCFRMKAGRDRSQPVTVALVEDARENLILSRQTHLDQLADKLQEERVRRVIEPLLAGDDSAEAFRSDDVDYLVDLGLIRQTLSGAVGIANPIYQQVIPRELGWGTQARLTQDTAWYVKAAGRLDLAKLLAAFQQFFREHSEHWVERFQYKEASPQLLLQAFLQRIVNGGGRIEREYGLGRLRTDLLVLWNHPGGVQKVVIELKRLHKSLAKTLETGLEQTLAYLDRCGAEEGQLVIFDRTPGKPWDEKLFQLQEIQGRTVWVWGM
jgi:hypothetical protein